MTIDMELLLTKLKRIKHNDRRYFACGEVFLDLALEANYKSKGVEWINIIDEICRILNDDDD